MCWKRRGISAKASRSCTRARSIRVVRSIALLLPIGAGRQGAPLARGGPPARARHSRSAASPRPCPPRRPPAAPPAGPLGRLALPPGPRVVRGRAALAVPHGRVGAEGEQELDHLELGGEGRLTPGCAHP